MNGLLWLVNLGAEQAIQLLAQREQQVAQLVKQVAELEAKQQPPGADFSGSA